MNSSLWRERERERGRRRRIVEVLVAVASLRTGLRADFADDRQDYDKHGNTAVSWIRNLFHDCIVKPCDASLLLETANVIASEQKSSRSFGVRNF